MDTQRMTKRMKDLIVEGRLEDAADELITFFDEEVMDKQEKDAFYLYNQTIQQLSQLNDLRHQQLAGLLDEQTINRRRNQIRQALLDLTYKLEMLQPAGQAPPKSSPVAAAAPRKRNPGWWVGPTILLAAAVALIWFRPWERNARHDNRTVTDPPALEAPAESANDDQPPTSPAATQTITLQPDARAIGNGGLSGALRGDGSPPFAPPEFGDWGRAIPLRGFLTFDLGEIPRNSQLVAARLYCAQGGQTGNPAAFSTILIEQVRLGGTLDATDFDLTGSLVGRVALGDLRDDQPIDVLDAVRLARRNNERALSLRFRPSRSHNNDDTRDVWAFNYTSGRTRLEVEIE